MSYEEFKSEFIKAQKNVNAPYKMFVFDLKGSRKMDDYTRYDAQVKSINTLKLLAKTLREIEIKTGKAILLHDERVRLNFDFSISNPNTSNPCVNAGDSFAISIFNGTCTDKEIINMFLEIAKKLENKYAYYVSIGNFETTNYVTAYKECYIGYCLAELSFNKKIRKMVINENQNSKENEQ